MAEKKEKWTGIQKAAALLIMLGPDLSSEILKRLEERQVEQISFEMAMMESISPELKSQILDEVRHLFLLSRGSMRGGVPFTRHVLKKSLGPEKAVQIVNRLKKMRSQSPFDFIKEIDPRQLMNFIQSEHPQTIALILAHLDPNHSVLVLSSLPPEQQAEVARRIATMDKTAPDVIKQIEDVLEKKLSTVFRERLTSVGGVKTIAQLLNKADKTTEQNILQKLEKQHPELADEIKKMMFVFEDIVLVEDRGIQRVLKEIDNKELALALKTASDEVKEKIFKNMSKRAGEAIREDMEFMGPVRLRDVEEAQQRIVSVIRKLEESGEIMIRGRGGKEDEIIA